MHTPHMVPCIDCGKDFDIGRGYILMHCCPECMAKPAPPPAYIERNGLLVPNPDARHPDPG